MGLADLAAAALTGYCVWRLSRRQALALAAALASPLLPIALHEHAQLTPETIVAPLLVTGALLCARRSRAGYGGMLLALAAAFKVAFFLPALAIALASVARKRALLGLLGGGLLLGGAALAVFGTGVWRETIVAQLQVGGASLHYAGGLIAQAAWNEFALVVCAGAGVWLVRSGRTRVSDPALMRTLTVAAAVWLLLALTVLKRGSYINVLIPGEGPLLALAACGAAWSWQRWRLVRPAIVALCALLAAQSLSLLVDPGAAGLAKRPGAASGLSWVEGPAAVDAAVALARHCPRHATFSGPPYIALLARRPMPGGQPDLFMLANAPTDAAFARRAAAASGLCP